MRASAPVRESRRPYRFLTALAGLLLVPGGGRADDVDFVRDVRPIFAARCFACHGAVKQESGLRLDTGAAARRGGDSGPAVEPGEARQSLLLQRVTAADPADRMPPEGDALDSEQIARIQAWIDAGAASPADERLEPDPRRHWAFQTLDRAITARRPGIDGFVVEALAEAGLEPSPRADRVTLIRRLFLDMHGLPPTPGQIERFLADDRPVAWPELVDRVLASPRYGERWGQHWLDIVRYADTHGYEVNTPREHAWRYRDYVIRALNDDLPYDRFVFEQLAGDTVGQDAATGFLVAAPVLLPGQIGKDDASIRLARQDALDEIISGTSGTFLGLTIGCARCHDHKFDPTSQRDYYAMQAFFAGVDYGDREIDDRDRRERMARAKAIKPRIAELQDALAQFEPLASAGRTLIIDDEDPSRATALVAGDPEPHAAGTERGQRDDPGSDDRLPHLGRGGATRLAGSPGSDVFAWNPGVAGRFRLWISWGADGAGKATTEARYLLDRDGNLETRDDQVEVARADQSRFADTGEPVPENQFLWSGLLDAGRHDWTATTRLVLRCGPDGQRTSADVVVLEEATETDTAAAIFPRLRAPVNALGNTERFDPVAAKFVRFTTFETIDDNRHEPCLDELEVFLAGEPSRNIALADHGCRASSSGNYSETGKHQLQHINDGRYGNSQSWISDEKGGGWVQLEFAAPQTIDRIRWSRDREGQYKDRLPVRYAVHVSMDGHTWRTVAGAADRVPPGTPYDELAARVRTRGALGLPPGVDLAGTAAELRRLEALANTLEQPAYVYGGVFREPDRTFVLNRGDPEQPLDSIGPNVPEFLGTDSLPPATTDRERRVALARWITGDGHPLAARVMVNRIWQYHFGRGIVGTPSDFGLNGAPPTHPELLDWLAATLIDARWSIKHMHRLILNSETYCQSNLPDEAALAVDRDCRLLWRFPSRRLEAEAIRDGMLLVSGRLNLAMGGPGFDFFESRGGLSGFPPIERFGPDQLRRMIYAHKVRMEPVPVFGSFDCPDAGQATPERSRSTTAIQALNLLNSPFVLDQAEAFAARAASAAGPAMDAQIDFAYRSALGRPPSPVERAASRDVALAHGLATVCRVLYNSNEFLFFP